MHQLREILVAGLGLLHHLPQEVKHKVEVFLDKNPLQALQQHQWVDLVHLMVDLFLEGQLKGQQVLPFQDPCSEGVHLDLLVAFQVCNQKIMKIQNPLKAHFSVVNLN